MRTGARRIWTLVAAGALLGGIARAGAQAALRATYDFEDGSQGFTGIRIEGGAFAPDAAAVTHTKVKEQVKNGAGALAYSYSLQPNVFNAVAALGSLPDGAQAFRFWARGGAPTGFVIHLREEDGSTYQGGFYLPAYEWTLVEANLDELTLGDNEQDENGKLDANQVTSFGLSDVCALFVSAPEELRKLLPDFRGSRQVWLDDVQFLTTEVAQTSGAVAGEKAIAVDSFETPTVHWTPARVRFTDNMPRFDPFPSDTALSVLPDAAPPGAAKSPTQPGGKGLRYAYKRAPQEIYALSRNLNGMSLAGVDRLKLSLNLSQKSLVIIELKEKDDSKYQLRVEPDKSVGWQNLDLPLTSFGPSDDSKDENNRLDPDQIKEITILDLSSAAGLPGPGETTMELDAVSFGLKP
jgi:hypothetical protein